MTDLTPYPPPEQWHDYQSLNAKAWPEQVEEHHTLVPTTCFNCEAACGLLAHVNHETGRIDKIEGNPLHPASRGRTCAKGPATLNQVDDPEIQEKLMVNSTNNAHFNAVIEPTLTTPYISLAP